MSNLNIFLMILCMAGITYLIRMIPMTFFKKKIRSEFLYSFFEYIPYAVLAAMTFPYIIYATGSVFTAVCGTVAAIVTALLGGSLPIVALISAAAVYSCSFIPPLF